MIILGDALHLPLRDNSVDAIVCDPPYADQMEMFGVTLAKILRHEGFTDDENVLSWTAHWATEAFRVLRPAGFAFVFSSARTFPFLVSDVPPILLGVSGDDDLSWHFAPSKYGGGLEAAGFTFHCLHTWMYGTGNPRGTTTKPAWEAIVVVRKDRPRTRRVTTINLLPTLRDLLPRLDAERRAIAEGILSDPTYDQRLIFDDPAFMGAFDHLIPAPVLADFQEPQYWQPGQHFYVSKPSVTEQNEGLEGLPLKKVKKFGLAKILRRNTHPTPKPVKLMRILVELACPSGGTVLDPFAGSGSTGMACAYEGRRFIGIEREADYVEIAKRRIAYARQIAGTEA